MTEIITEKDCPIRWRWLLKPVMLTILIGLSLMVLLIPSFFWLSERMRAANPSESVPSLLELIIITAVPVAIAVTLSLFFFGPVMIAQRLTFHYSFEDQFLHIKQGVISKQNRYFPFEVIQNVLLKQDLLDKLLRITSVVVENATRSPEDFAGGFVKNHPYILNIGSKGNQVIIPGLAKQDAEMLKSLLLQKMRAGNVRDNKSEL